MAVDDIVPVCDICFDLKREANNWATVPHRVLAIDDDGNPTTGYAHDWCCYCGDQTDGIYVRASAESVHGVPAT